MDWPGNSPDLNPIEHVWKALGEKSAAKAPRNKPELVSSLLRVWHREISEEFLHSLVESMPRRCEAVIRARGGNTKY